MEINCLFVHKVISCCYCSNPDSVTSPNHNDVRSPSEVSSSVNMDNIDKLPSPSDSGTVSPNNEQNNDEAINGKQLHP